MSTKDDLQKAITQKCIWCMNADKNVYKLIEACKSTDCPLWAYRMIRKEKI